jgi:hypothetical protein
MARPHAMVYLLCLWIPVQYWVTKELGLLPVFFVWCDEALVVLLAATLVLQRLQRRRPWVVTPIDLPLVAFVLMAIVSIILNRVPPLIAALGLRDLLQYVVVFYGLATLPLTPKWDRHWLRIVFAAGLIQAPIALVQALSYFRLSTARIAEGNYDMSVGTFGPSGGDMVAYFIVFLLFLLLGRARLGDRSGLVLLPVLLVPFVISTSRLCFLFLPIGLAWFYRREIRRNPRTLIGPALIALVAAVGLLAYYWNDKELMRMVLDPSVIVASQFNFSLTYQGRMVHYPIAWWILHDMAASPLVGVGPGMYVGATASFFMVPITRLVYDMFQVDPTSGRFGTVNSGILPLLVPYGILGAALFVFLVARLYRMGASVAARAGTMTSRALGMSFQGILFFLAVGSLAAPVWETQILAFHFWLLAGLTFRAGRREGVFR